MSDASDDPGSCTFTSATNAVLLAPAPLAQVYTAHVHRHPFDIGDALPDPYVHVKAFAQFATHCTSSSQPAPDLVKQSMHDSNFAYYNIPLSMFTSQIAGKAKNSKPFVFPPIAPPSLSSPFLIPSNALHIPFLQRVTSLDNDGNPAIARKGLLHWLSVIRIRPQLVRFDAIRPDEEAFQWKNSIFAYTYR